MCYAGQWLAPLPNELVKHYQQNAGMCSFEVTKLQLHHSPSNTRFDRKFFMMAVPRMCIMWRGVCILLYCHERWVINCASCITLGRPTDSAGGSKLGVHFQITSSFFLLKTIYDWMCAKKSCLEPSFATPGCDKAADVQVVLCGSTSRLTPAH